jgi:membrane dipeptidase
MLDVTEPQLATAARILSDATVILLHTDVVSCDVGQQRSLGEREVLTRRHLPLWQKAHVTATFETVGGTTMHQTFPTRALNRSGSSYTLRALELIDAMLSEITEQGDRFLPLRTAPDVTEAKRSGRVAIGFSFEGGEPLGDDLALLRTFWRLGLRMVQPVWLTQNQFGASFRQPHAGGLTGLGVELVQEMGRLGMLMDVSHLNDSGFADVVKHATGPIVASHSNARARMNHLRNLTDDQLKAIAASGGVIGLNKLLTTETGRTYTVGDTTLRGGTVEDIVDQLEYIGVTVGMDRVALGLDLNQYQWPKEVYQSFWKGTFYDLPFAFPGGMEDIGQLVNLVAVMVKRGHHERDIRAALGENSLRLLSASLRPAIP